MPRFGQKTGHTHTKIFYMENLMRFFTVFYEKETVNARFFPICPILFSA